MHGDWYLALASYNWGENAVARAIEKNRAKGLPTDYLSLGMPAETRNYVPKLQALKNIIANPHAFGVDLEPVPNTPYFVTVEQTRDMDVHLAAKLADMPLTEFLALNPAHNRPLIVAQGWCYRRTRRKFSSPIWKGGASPWFPGRRIRSSAATGWNISPPDMASRWRCSNR